MMVRKFLNNLINQSGFLFVLVVLALHYQLIVSDNLIFRDDYSIVMAIKNTTSLPNYFSNLLSGYYLDFQPVRDLTLYFNLVLSNVIGYGGFHLFNVLLLLINLYFIGRLLKLLGHSDKGIALVLILISAHPILNSTAAWVSNRKHLLSILFITLYLFEEMRNDKTRFWSLVWCLLSFLSQPITVFIPMINVFLKKKILKKITNQWDLFIVLVSIITVVLNYWFYSSFVHFLGRNAVLDIHNNTGIQVLKVCRVAFQVLVPISLAVEYDLGSIYNFIGIVLTILTLFLFYKFEKRRSAQLAFLMVLSTLFPVLNWGPRDAYLLVITLSLSFYLIKLEGYFSKKIIVPYLLVLIFLLVHSHKFTNMWSSDLDLAETSYKTEGGADNLYLYSIELSKKFPHKAVEIFNHALSIYPDLTNFLVLQKKAEAIYNSLNTTDLEKLEVFRGNNKSNVFDVFYHSLLLKKMGYSNEHQNARKSLIFFLSDKPTKSIFTTLICPKFPLECKNLGI